MNKEQKIQWYKKEFDSIANEIKKKDSLSYLDFLRIRNFKLNNISPENEETILRITKKAFELAKEDKIEEAVSFLRDNLEGVRIPTASAILAMKFPDKYCIIDKVVIRNLGKEEEWGKGYLTKPGIYEAYLMLMRQEAKRKGMKLREYERKLFEKNYKLKMRKR